MRGIQAGVRLSFVFACALFTADAHVASAGPPKTAVSPSKVLAGLTTAGGVAFPDDGARREQADHTLAPYFHVTGSHDKADLLPLKETHASIAIAGVIASVTVRQIFENHRQEPIEATYVFPASTRAAVHNMRMCIGTRTIEARIEKRSEARAQYQAAKKEGRRASLLEQQRPNVFTTNVANVMPGDRIEVSLTYSEMLVPEDGTYELVYPTVVGPRYGGGADSQRDRWIASPYLEPGRPEPYTFSLYAKIQGGVPLKDVASPSHPIKVEWQSPTTAAITLAKPGGANRDFVLRYRLAGGRIETGVLLWDDAAARYFALLVEPPHRPKLAEIPPREYIFLLDVSGSMYGFPLDTAKALMRDLLGGLRPTDRFNVVLFAGSSAVWSPNGSRPASGENIAEAIRLVERHRGGGGTELMGGLQASYAIPPAGDRVSRTVVVVTDGFVGVEAQAFRFIRERLNQANLFAFGIGSSVNRALIEGMARAGMGEPFVVLDKSHAARAAERLRALIARPVLTDIDVRFEGMAPSDVAPQKVPDLMAERPLLVYGKLAPGAFGTIAVTGKTPAGRFAKTVTIGVHDARPENAALRALWARKWIQLLDDERAMGGGQPVEDAITALGLEYGLLTAFTSFVAVDSQVANRGRAATTVRQPLPLPEGVSEHAIGSAGILGTLGDSGGAHLAPIFGRDQTIGLGGGGLGGRRARAPEVVASTPVIRGALDRAALERVIQRHRNEVRFCYEQELATHPTLSGRVQVQLTIASSGDVLASVLRSSTLGNSRVEGCVVQAARRWRFPKIAGGGIAIVSYPFVFNPPRPKGRARD